MSSVCSPLDLSLHLGLVCMCFLLDNAIEYFKKSLFKLIPKSSLFHFLPLKLVIQFDYDEHFLFHFIAFCYPQGLNIIFPGSQSCLFIVGCRDEVRDESFYFKSFSDINYSILRPEVKIHLTGLQNDSCKLLFIL